MTIDDRTPDQIRSDCEQLPDEAGITIKELAALQRMSPSTLYHADRRKRYLARLGLRDGYAGDGGQPRWFMGEYRQAVGLPLKSERSNIWLDELRHSHSRRKPEE